MSITSTYNILYNTLNYIGFTRKIEYNDETNNIDKTELPDKKIYHISKTPYKDALMKGLKQYKFKNVDYKYYQRLGDTICKIVDEHISKRTYSNWWVDDYQHESYLIRDNKMKKLDYCVVLSRKKLNMYPLSVK